MISYILISLSHLVDDLQFNVILTLRTEPSLDTYTTLKIHVILLLFESKEEGSIIVLVEIFVELPILGPMNSGLREEVERKR